MTELDVVQWTRLRRRFENVLKGEPEATSIWCYKAEAEAIIAALEDRDRLWAAAMRMRRWRDQMFRLGVLAEQDLDSLLAALEGRE